MAPKKSEEKSGGEATSSGTVRNLKHITEERERLAGAKQRILNELAEAEDSVDAEAREEQRLHVEELRAGRPGQPSKKLKAAEDQVRNLRKQIPTITLLEIKLSYEEAKLEREGAEKQMRAEYAVLEKAAEKAKAAEAERQDVYNRWLAARERGRRWQEAIHHHRNRLLQLEDEDILREVEERNEKNRALAASLGTPEYKAEGHNAMVRAGGGHVLECPEDERALREAAARDQSTHVHIPGPSPERGW